MIHIKYYFNECYQTENYINTINIQYIYIATLTTKVAKNAHKLTNSILEIEGTSCETQIDECSSDPCANGASCVDWLDLYYCTCAAGYTGN